MTTDHPAFELLSEFADGELAPESAASVQRHVATCVTCREELARLRAIIERAGNLSPRIEPPAGTWSAVRSRLRRQAQSTARRRAWIRDWGLRAAAALVLVAGSSALTVLALRSRMSDRVTATPRPATVLAIPAAVRAVDRSYAAVLDELTVTLDAQRGALSPETVATLERTLRVIDEAIAEARAALAADPGNGALLDVLSANYEQKVQLLRRVSELSART
jgi:hypothetical protein